MAAKVQFKYGTAAQFAAMLASADRGTLINNGTFYITTDTQQIFLGQSNGNYLTLGGSIIVADAVEDLPNIQEKGITEGTIYYIKSMNMLCIAQKKKNTTNLEWTVINPDTFVWVSEFKSSTPTVTDDNDNIPLTYQNSAKDILIKIDLAQQISDRKLLDANFDDLIGENDALSQQNFSAITKIPKEQIVKIVSDEIASANAMTYRGILTAPGSRDKNGNIIFYGQKDSSGNVITEYVDKNDQVIALTSSLFLNLNYETINKGDTYKCAADLIEFKYEDIDPSYSPTNPQTDPAKTDVIIRIKKGDMIIYNGDDGKVGDRISVAILKNNWDIIPSGDEIDTLFNLENFALSDTMIGINPTIPAINAKIKLKSGTVIGEYTKDAGEGDFTVGGDGAKITVSKSNSGNIINIAHNEQDVTDNDGTSDADKYTISATNRNFIAVTGLEYDDYGHLTEIDRTNFILPADNDTTYDLLGPEEHRLSTDDVDHKLVSFHLDGTDNSKGSIYIAGETAGDKDTPILVNKGIVSYTTSTQFNGKEYIEIKHRQVTNNTELLANSSTAPETGHTTKDNNDFTKDNLIILDPINNDYVQVVTHYTRDAYGHVEQLLTSKIKVQALEWETFPSVAATQG